MSRFTSAAKAATSTSFVTAGRDKISTEDIITTYPEGITITALDRMGTGADYYYAVAFKEDPKAFFFSGTILTKICDNMVEMFSGDCEVTSTALKEEGGLKIRLHTEKSEKTNRYYTACDILD